MNFNCFQKEAVSHVDGPMLVIAGPGSGKTSVIIHRIHNMITTYNINPSSILTATFSKAAAVEMKTRYQSCFSREDSSVIFGTLHSIFFQILKHYPGNSVLHIIPDQERHTLLSQALQSTSPDDSQKYLTMQKINVLASEISRMKNSGQSPETFRPKGVSSTLFPECYSIYQNYLQEKRYLDFDDILLCTDRILENDQAYLSDLQQRFPYILVDEFQDVNLLQYRLLCRLASRHRNLFAVGDDDQCIYGFRGSQPEIMDRFRTQFPDCKVVHLKYNYRNPKCILMASRRLISHNQNRIRKDSFCVSSGIDSACSLLSYENEQEEYAGIINMIQKHHRQGFSYSEIAILLRDRHNAGYIETCFAEKKIPVRQMNLFYSSPASLIQRDIRSYFSLSLDLSSREDLIRILNRPNRMISRSALTAAEEISLWDSMMQYYQNLPFAQNRIIQLRKQICFLQGMSPYAALQYIRKCMDYDSFLHETAAQNGFPEKTYDIYLNQLKSELKKYKTIQEYLQAADNNHSMFSPIQQEDPLQILTIHASKGLEYPVVFLPDLNMGFFPRSSHNNSDLFHTESTDLDLEEERRLLYVGMTRSSQYLYLSYTRTIHGKPSLPSSFLEEI